MDKTKLINNIGNYRWTICTLLFFGTTINYLDRQVLSLLHPILEEELNWTNTDYGLITAVFQLTYGLFTLLSGRLIDKIGTKKGYAIALIVWSIGAILHAFAIPIGKGTSDLLGILGITGISVSVAGFIIARAILAIGESANFPAAIKATAEYFPKKERSLATGIFNSGSNIGAILAPLTVPWIAYHLGWEISFILIGSLGFVWLVFWWIYYDEPSKQKRLTAQEYEYITEDSEVNSINPEEIKETKTSWFKLLAFRETWAFTLGKFFTDGVWWFLLFWLPSYLTSQFGLKNTDITLPLAVLYSMTMVGSICGGWFPLYFIKKGYDTAPARRKAMFFIALIPLVVLLVQPLGEITFWIPVLLIGTCASAHQAWSANLYSTVSDMFPKSAIASVIGIGTMAGSIGGALTSFLVGKLFDAYKASGDLTMGYTIVFSFCAVAYLFAWFIMKLLVPKLK
ncbi:MFS transporter [Flavobacterium alkalisoli]|uniref:MFS transporter n=1 Tax=Flavobacterium alkalisoli TaxID=2602769 RepID=UPI003A93C353